MTSIAARAIAAIDIADEDPDIEIGDATIYAALANAMIERLIPGITLADTDWELRQLVTGRGYEDGTRAVRDLQILALSPVEIADLLGRTR